MSTTINGEEMVFERATIAERMVYWKCPIGSCGGNMVASGMSGWQVFVEHTCDRCEHKERCPQQDTTYPKVVRGVFVESQ